MNSCRAAIIEPTWFPARDGDVSKPLVLTRHRLTDDAERLSREFPAGRNVAGRVEIDP
jgi:hypothetical protein